MIVQSTFYSGNEQSRFEKHEGSSKEVNSQRIYGGVHR